MSSKDRAFAGNDQSAARWYAAQPNWWTDHYDGAVTQAMEFLHGDGIATEGRDLLDLGCGDGIISLGLLHKTGARTVTGLDLVPVDLPFLEEMARDNGAPSPGASSNLTFSVSEVDSIPAPDQSFDVVTAWSVFEHVSQPVNLLREVLRVLRPGGVLFIQIWPMWFSEHGSHLWPWFDQTFAQLRLSDDEVASHLHERIDDPALADAMVDLYRSCNRITVDELQEAIVEAGFYLAKVELTGSSFHVPPELQRVPVSRTGIEAIKLLAVRQ